MFQAFVTILVWNLKCFHFLFVEPLVYYTFTMDHLLCHIQYYNYIQVAIPKAMNFKCISNYNIIQYLQTQIIILEMLTAKISIFVFLLLQCFAIVDRTYYIYLGLDITASAEQIKQAYEAKKSKLQSLEEDQARKNKLSLLEEAYQVLGNKDKRLIYDRLNKDLFRNDKVVSSLKKITDKNNRKGKTILLTLPVSVEDVYHGKTVEATYLKQTACKKCRGTGAQSPKFLKPCSRCGGNGFNVVEGVNQFGQKFANENTCTSCQGWGKQITKACPECSGKKINLVSQKVNIKIPQGLPDGNIIRINNFGDEPITGAPSDLQVTIVEIPTQKWARQGQNLIHTVQISLKEAIFGFKKAITHLNQQEIPIERTGVITKINTITIPNKGIENIKTGKVGKLIIKFKIIMPKFTDEQLDMWQRFFDKHKL